MGTTLQTFQTLVQTNMARDDAPAMVVIKAAINYAAMLAALLFEPPELKKDSNLTVTGGSDSINLSSLTNWLDVVFILNFTDALPMGFIPFECWHSILPTTVGSTKYYTVFGNKLYVKDGPATNKVLKVFYSCYPALLANPTDALEFDHHDAYVVSVATGLSFAAFEEDQSAAMWQKTSELITLPLIIGGRARQVIAGRKTSLEAAVSSILQGQGG